MSQVPVSAMLDLLGSAYKDYKPAPLTSIAQNLQDYVAANNIVTDKRVQTSYSGPHGASFKIIARKNPVAKSEALHAKRDYKNRDITEEGNEPWSFAFTYSSYERREFRMNMGKKRIFNLIQVGEFNANLSLAEDVIEPQFWGCPASVSDNLKARGVFYWLTYSATEGFNGADLSAFPAGRAGLTTAANPNWANRTAQYSQITSGDACLKIRRSFDKCRFKSPTNKVAFRTGSGKKWQVYGSNDTVLSFENAAVEQNDRLGGDLGTYDGVTTIRRNPFVRVPQLDAMSTSAPIIGINWDSFGIAVPEGGAFYKHPPRALSDQPNTVVSDTDFQWQVFCNNLRTCFLIAKSDPISDL